MRLFLLIFSLLISYSVFSQSKCTLTYIANEGFLIETQGKKILADALFDKIDGSWCHSPSGDTLNALKNATSPFNDIDIIVVSHKHVDHFNKNVVANHLLSNSKTILICPKQVNDELSQLESYNLFSNRITAITPQLNSDTNVIVADIKIRVLRLEHSHYMETDSASGESVNRHRNIENVGYLFNINGVKVFHCGDTNPLNEKEYSTFALQNEEIDIACLERLFFSKGKEGMDILNNFIAPKNIALMHVKPGNIQLFKNHFSKVENMHVFENKMEQITYTVEP